MATELPGYYGTNNRLMTELQTLATRDTAEYFYNLEIQPQFIPADVPETFASLDASKAKCRYLASKHVTLDGFVAEYGVDKGKSFLELCSRFAENTVFGFDAFDGLPNDGEWPGNIVHDDEFRNGGVVPFDIPANGKVTVGWFNETLPAFDYGKSVAKFLHIDCDIYTGTVDILHNIADAIVPGTVIVFDDYCNHTNWRQGEYRAWQEFVNFKKLQYQYLYVAGMSVALKVI